MLWLYIVFLNNSLQKYNSGLIAHHVRDQPVSCASWCALWALLPVEGWIWSERQQTECCLAVRQKTLWHNTLSHLLTDAHTLSRNPNYSKILQRRPTCKACQLLNHTFTSHTHALTHSSSPLAVSFQDVVLLKYLGAAIEVQINKTGFYISNPSLYSLTWNWPVFLIISQIRPLLSHTHRTPHKYWKNLWFQLKASSFSVKCVSFLNN